MDAQGSKTRSAPNPAKVQRVSIELQPAIGNPASSPLAPQVSRTQSRPDEMLLPQNYGFFGRLRSAFNIIRASPWHHRMFCGVALLQIIVFTTDRVSLIATNSSDYSKDPNPEAAYRQAVWICLIIAISAIFAGYYAIHAVVSANAFELITFFATTAALIVRHLVAVGECDTESSTILRANTDSEQDACYGFMAASVALSLTAMVLVFFMYRDLIWKKYKAIGAEVQTQRMYRQYEIFMAVRKLDVQFSIVTLVTGLIFFTFDDFTAKVASGLNAVLLVVEVAWERASFEAVHTENKTAMYIFWALSVFLPAFIINVGIQHAVLLQYVTADPIFVAVCLFAVVAMVNRVVTVILGYLMYRSFGQQYRGLRRILQGGGAIEKFEKAKLVQADKPATNGAKLVANPLHATQATSGSEEESRQNGIAVVETLAPRSSMSSVPGSVSPSNALMPERSFVRQPSNAAEFMDAIDQFIESGDVETALHAAGPPTRASRVQRIGGQ